MKLWLARITIAGYLTALLMGVACHAMNFGLSVHPITYYFVWDMFCGWSAHEVRYHLIGETDDGTYYQLSPAPWNTFAPYGDLERGQYDTLGHCHAKIALNTLKHTDHPPISRIFLVEEMWSKKYNLPDGLWALRFDEPKDPHSYFWVKATLAGDGSVLQYNRDILTKFTEMAVADNPRLKADSMKAKPFLAVSPHMRTNAFAPTHDGTFDSDSNWSAFSGAGTGSTDAGTGTGAGAELHPSAN